MKPFKAFLFLFIVLISFLLVLFFEEQYDNEQEEFQSLTEIDSIVLEPVSVDTLVKTKPIVAEIEPVEALPDTIEKRKLINPQPFIFSSNDSLGFQFLFRKLAKIDQEKLPVRIVYFGDSQIENDQITLAFRKKLQAKFGGRGLGFVSLDHMYNSGHQLILEKSKNWKQNTYQDEVFKSKSILFKNTYLDERGNNEWFLFKRIKSLNPQPDYQLLKLYYNLFGRTNLQVSTAGNLIYEGWLPAEDGINVLDFDFNRTPDEIKFKFKESDHLDILGISLETKHGILVDNIALRGLSYPTFEWSDEKAIRQMIDKLNIGMFVFHFGVNLVPYQSKDYFYFRKHFKQQVLFLKENYPEVPILIVGVSDMAKKNKGKLESFPNVQQIKNIQKTVAMETGAVFWDLEAFMGGKGGMINWVNANPKFGRKDFIHFTKEGADAIGNELAEMIITAFENDSTKK